MVRPQGGQERDRRVDLSEGGPGGGATRPMIDCGNLDLRIEADGSWHYHGSRIDRQPLVRLFASVLRREPDGSYWLVTPVERGRVEVADAPFLAVEAEVTGEGQARRVRLRTNLDRWVELGPEHGLRSGQGPDGGPRLYAQLEGGLEAALARPVWYQLLELAIEDSGPDGPVGLWAGGHRHDLSSLAADGDTA